MNIPILLENYYLLIDFYLILYYNKNVKRQWIEGKNEKGLAVTNPFSHFKETMVKKVITTSYLKCHYP